MRIQEAPMDYGRQVQFGLFLTPGAGQPGEVLRLARLADQLGLDLLGVQDHPYQPRFLDAWTLLSVVAAQTERLRVFPDVANLLLRPPAVLAKAAATLDLLSGGRVELGLGAGAFGPAAQAMGALARTPGQSISALEEAIQVIRLMWTGQRSVRFRGDHYQLGGVHTGPVPAHRIGIWLGLYRPRGLALVGRLADGWVPSLPYLPPEALPEAHRRIDEAAGAAGRDPAGIQRIYNIWSQEGAAHQWVDQLTALTVEHGMDTYVLGTVSEEELRRFAIEVAPRVRENVDRRRAAVG
jgi:alkanesulfonate monooxygenase SsuD/methylene tetrahydromethanopterin reductase-like flavin-dependent oxidoreductase (luciferase family)